MQISTQLLQLCGNVHMNFGRETNSNRGSDSLTHHLSLYCVWFGLATAACLKGISLVFLISEVKSSLRSKLFLLKKDQSD